MKSNKEYREISLASLRGNWTPAVITAIIYIIIIALGCGKEDITNRLNLQPGFLWTLRGVGTALTIFVLAPASIGFSNAFRCLQQNGNPNILQNFLGFATRNYLHNIWVYIVMEIKIILWTFCLIVPGIMKSFSYAMVPYIMAEHPEYNATTCIAESERIMYGHRMELFTLYLSFIGWFLLAIITCGIGLLWLMPYMETAQAAFYADIKDPEVSTIIL